ncbi:hypothetical protein M408DRAFT_253724 [Serendipita vermifera MAFF 305830]|uniref:Bromo domain-containing protein n=1 Tax=Serendipita vermifera MAFF 305830 TaxID=933852 RepID=A0A0C2WYH9_SERVB|nr:hypothetical protein M408DRAFT_253724 [Serendipita vermifera MAFF 305830]
MKHLLAALAARKIPLDTNEGDLKSLLSRAQRFRGDTKGIESWEDTLEKILVELRTTEYATAFLKPVKKSEAWDYDRVILHPMDLQTMGRKVKSKSYLSKKAFADDLNLIWDNCLTYNSDPNHHLRRAAQYMRKKSDQILRRIPDRHERFAPSMIDRFKYSPSPSPFLSPAKPRLINGSTVSSAQIATPKPNGVLPGATQLTNGDAIDGIIGAKGDAGAATTSASTSAGAAGAANATEPQTTMIHAGVTNIPFGDRPALERSAEGMATFVGFDAAMDEFLASWNPDEQPVEEATGPSGASDTRPRSSSMLSTGLPVLDVNTRLRQLADEDDELAVWKLVMDDANDASQLDASSDVDGSDSGIVDATKKRKRGEDMMMLPRKRQRLERIPAPERNPLENWWFAMGSTALLANAVPPSVDSPPMPNPRYVRMQAARQARSQAGEEQEDRPRRPKRSDGPSRSLFHLMSENVRTRKRARDIAIKIADQIEDEKQGVDPEDMTPLVPVDAVAASQPRKPWARRAALASRRRMEAWEDAIGPAEAQDCMESTAMLILEHANFDSSSTAALQAFGDIGGRCIQNLGHSLKVLNETHRGKMTAEEMVLHALFSNSIGSIYELEAYIKSDIIKHGAGLSNMLQTLEDVVSKAWNPTAVC